ncbi:MAG TPA: aminopeptidase, partial [Gemmatimonadaceae bacterium]|nr:aminopeptidase [Gemmatimonadaceae bacterium]
MRLLLLLLRSSGVLALAAVGYLALFPTGRYVTRAAWEEAHILARRQSIPALIADPATSPHVRAKLQLVLDARAYAQDSLHLRAGRSFTTYSTLTHDTLVLVLSGAYRDRLEPVTWWFPVVGRVPYKGFFDFAAARAAEHQLQADSLDAYLRPSPAFSTLGFFNDPLLSTSIADDSAELANTVIHELTHNTFYASGQAVFNESFANFAGSRGAAQFFRSRGDTALAGTVDNRWHDEVVMARFWERTYRALDSAYRAHPEGKAARIAAHDTVYERARDDLIRTVGPQLLTVVVRYLARARLDNAELLARRIYLTDLDLFDAVFAREGHDARRAIAQVIALARTRPDDPYGAVRDWLSGSGGAP